jgi:membrane fusion protein, multidrug efflux system
MPAFNLRAATAFGLFALLAACGQPAPQPPAPPEVGVMTVHPTSVPLTRNFPGRLAATLTAQVRARVTGIVLKRAYTEGTDVKAGDVLFRIDPAPLEASLRTQEGQLAQAEATATDTRLKARRMQELGKRGVVARQDVDDAVAAARQAEAAVRAAQGNVQNAKIDLGYASVTAPISGRAGRANVTQGALVSPTDADPLTTVQVIDPIYANFSEPMAEVEQLREAERSGDLKLAAPDKAQVQIVLPDGSVYRHTGTLDFRDLAVDPQTGAVSLRALVPNPDHSLLPGMFVTIRLTLGMRRNAFEVPQAAVQRDTEGAFVYVVGAGNKVVQKRVQLDGQRGSQWVVQSGLTGGERVIVSGLQKARPGAVVKPAAYTPAAAAPATTHSSGD